MEMTPGENATKSPYETALICMCVVDSLGLLDIDQTASTAGDRPKKIPRVRHRVEDLMYELGPSACRRYYRMDESCFWSLHQTLKPFIDEVTAKRLALKRAREKMRRRRLRAKFRRRYYRRMRNRRSRVLTPNGTIPSETRLSHVQVFISVWTIVDAIHLCSQLDFEFPQDHDEQRKLAEEFMKKSAAQFDCCVGAIDGILIWIERPSSSQSENAECGIKKFFCARKKKFGFNMQGTCDAMKKFLDVSIGHPASTSDYLSFVTSSLYHSLEKPDFLAPGLALFGDNAYVSNNSLSASSPSESESPWLPCSC